MQLPLSVLAVDTAPDISIAGDARCHRPEAQATGALSFVVLDVSNWVVGVVVVGNLPLSAASSIRVTSEEGGFYKLEARNQRTAAYSSAL